MRSARFAATTPVSVGPPLTWLKSAIATPQYAIAQSGSAAPTFPNDFSASSSQNECRSAMPWLNSALTCGLHEILNEIDPSFDGIEVSAMRPMRAMLSSGLGLPMERSGSAQRTRRKAGTGRIVLNFRASFFFHALRNQQTV